MIWHDDISVNQDLIFLAVDRPCVQDGLFHIVISEDGEISGDAAGEEIDMLI